MWKNISYVNFLKAFNSSSRRNGQCLMYNHTLLNNIRDIHPQCEPDTRTQTHLFTLLLIGSWKLYFAPQVTQTYQNHWLQTAPRLQTPTDNPQGKQQQITFFTKIGEANVFQSAFSSKCQLYPLILQISPALVLASTIFQHIKAKQTLQQSLLGAVSHRVD